MVTPAKTPERTLHWSRICVAANDRAAAVRPGCTPDELTGCTGIIDAQRVRAEAEGYDDAAQYLQHILDDLAGR